ncbi:hypothetical protein [Micromonospora pattaloongensis]|uniref:hypothetical protein n=1 Tax=Micromonospora pattaloongensis TaxID=405436 RepID=UPI0011151476|nr:hypothetical protein [Micromonospora pattaloongensis]
MQAATWRFPLAVGFERTRRSRIVTLSVLGAMAVGVAGGVGYAVGRMAVWAFACPGRHPYLQPVAVVPAVIAAAVVAGGAAVMIAFVGRTGAWLEGTFLTVRNLTARTVNLAAARAVILAPTAHGPPPDAAPPPVGGVRDTPVLTVVTDAATVRLRLRSRDGALLPPAQLRVLADVLAVARCPGGAEAVARLRAMAADPHTLLW